MERKDQTEREGRIRLELLRGGIGLSFTELMEKTEINRVSLSKDLKIMMEENRIDKKYDKGINRVVYHLTLGELYKESVKYAIMDFGISIIEKGLEKSMAQINSTLSDLKKADIPDIEKKRILEEIKEEWNIW